MLGNAQDDPHDLRRFIEARDATYVTALAELSQGRKRTHWIWFVFPQIEGLGISAIAHRYAIKSRAEATTYLEHPLLGVRLLECTETVLQHEGKPAHDIFGSPDDLKFRSSMTLFELVGGGPSFSTALESFYKGERDEPTLEIFATW